MVQVVDQMGAFSGGANNDPVTSDITFRNNIFNDSYNNDLLKIEDGVQRITVDGNMFYNQGGPTLDHHIDINSVKDITVTNNIFFNDYEGSNRPETQHASFIVIKDSSLTYGTTSTCQSRCDSQLGSENMIVAKNIFMQHPGYSPRTDAPYISIGEEEKDLYIAKQVTIENNLFLGSRRDRESASYFTIQSVDDLVIRNNTFNGDLPSKEHFIKFRVNARYPNYQSHNVRITNNIISDPTGTMGCGLALCPTPVLFTVQPGALNGLPVLSNNLFWNSGGVLPNTNSVLEYTNDARYIAADPLLADPHSVTPPRWVDSAGAFAGGGSTITDVFSRLATTFAQPSSASPVFDAAYGDVPATDILGNPRPSSVGTDVGAFELQVTPTPTPTPTPEGRYEAENATFGDETGGGTSQIANNHVGYSGSGFVDMSNTPDGIGGFIQWSVNVAAAAIYNLDFGYAVHSTLGLDSRPLNIFVNDQLVASDVVFPATASWTTWENYTFGAALVQGENTIKISATSLLGGPNVDYVDVSYREPLPPVCSDGQCNGLETCSTCPADCGACPVPPDPAYNILFVPYTVTIDGDLNEFSAAEVITVTTDSSSQGTYKLLWDDAYLYVGAHVTDTSLNSTLVERDAEVWLDDSLELVIDALHERSTERDGNDYKFVVNLNNAQRDMQGTTALWNVAFNSHVALQGTLNNDSDRDVGYTLEMKLPLNAIIPAPTVAGHTIGMDIGLNDTQGNGDRSLGYWRNTDGGNINQPNGWGSAVFSTDTVSVPEVNLRLEAEQAVYGDNNGGGTSQVASNHSGYSGTGFVDMSDYPHGVGGFVSWQVAVPVSAEYKIELGYASDGPSRPLRLVVNGDTVATPSLKSTGGWSSWKVRSFNVFLEAGTNTVLVEATKNVGGPNIDYLNVSTLNNQPVGF